MALPDITVTTPDGALGLSAASIEGLHAKVGVSASGTANSVYSLGDLATAKATLGSGPLLEDVAFQIATAGACLAVPVAASNPGVVGAILRTGTSPSPGLGTTGTPRDTYDVIAKIVAGGTVGNATFQISFDGGATFSDVIATAASLATFAASTGLTLTFVAGTYVAGDTYSFTTTAPTYSSADLNAALDALLADARDVSFVHVVGTVGGADDAAKITNFVALCTAVATKMATAEDAKRWQFTILEAPVVAEGAWAASATWAAFASTRVSPALGRVTIQSQVSGRQTTRSLAVSYASRLSIIPPHEHPGRTARGPLPGIVSMSRDERATPNGDVARFTTSRTFAGVPGFYLTAGKMAAGAGSDFAEVQARRVIDKACRLVNGALFVFLNESLRVNREDGTIFEADARNVESYVDAIVRAELVNDGNASDLQVVVNRATNMVSTKRLDVAVRVIPKGYASFIAADVGFLNPALQVV